MKFSSIINTNYITNYLMAKQMVLGFPINGLLKKLELSLTKNNVIFKHAPIFIIGNPRSGSTLLYQTITYFFKVCYFSNLMSLFPESPVCAAYMISRLSYCIPAYTFHSRYGKIAGWNSPNQAEHIWKCWFNDLYDGNMIFSEISKIKARQVRNSIGLLQRFFDLPSVHKWQPLSEKIISLARIFPEAIFVRIKRKREFIAQSILRSRRNLWGDDNRWFSTKPKNYEEIAGHNYLLQICKQVSSIENDIDLDLSAVGKERSFIVHYENLCDSPQLIMDLLMKFYEEKNPVGMNIRNLANRPKKFTCRNVVKIKAFEFDYIKKYFAKEERQSKCDDCYAIGKKL